MLLRVTRVVSGDPYEVKYRYVPQSEGEDVDNISS